MFFCIENSGQIIWNISLSTAIPIYFRNQRITLMIIGKEFYLLLTSKELLNKSNIFISFKTLRRKKN